MNKASMNTVCVHEEQAMRLIVSHFLHLFSLTSDSQRLTVRATSRLCRLLLKCDSTRAETRFRLSAKRTSPFKSAGASVQSITGSRGVRISGSNAGYTMFRGSVKSTGCQLHSTVSPFTSPPVRHRVPSHFNWTPSRTVA
jgi:hypothetical protein